MDNYILSVRPKWLAKILNREKTIELRKTAPKTPCVMLLYCTKAEPYLRYIDGVLCEKTDSTGKWGVDKEDINGNIVGQFTLEMVEKIDGSVGHPRIYVKACIQDEEAAEYSNGKPLFAWHISDLVIFDEPKELSDYGVKRAPQSYMKVKGV